MLAAEARGALRRGLRAARGAPAGGARRGVEEELRREARAARAAVARRLEEGGPAEAEREARWRLSEGRKLVQQLGEMLGIASTGH